MKRALLLTAVLSALSAGTVHAEQPYRECLRVGDLELGALQTKHLGCRKARVLIHSFMDHSAREGRQRVRTHGYFCRNVARALQPGIVCRRGARRARYLGPPPIG